MTNDEHRPGAADMTHARARLSRTPILAGALLLLLVACTTLKRSPDASDGPPLGDDSDAATQERTDAAVVPSDGAPSASSRCTVGTCPTETFLDALYGPVALVVSGQHVYFLEARDDIPESQPNGLLASIPADGSCASRTCFHTLDGNAFAKPIERESHLALGPNDICYAQSYTTGHAVVCFDLQTSTKHDLTTSSDGYASSVWVGASVAQWTVGTDPSVPDQQIRDGLLRSNGSAATIVQNRRDLTSVTSDGASTYFTERGAKADAGAVAALRPDGGVVALAGGRLVPVAAAVHGGYVYWAELVGRTIMRTKVDGTGAVEQVATTGEGPFDLAVDDSGTYWACAGATVAEGSVERGGLTPGSPVDVMMTGLLGVKALSVNATHVYAVAYGDNTANNGKIVRMAKSR